MRHFKAQLGAFLAVMLLAGCSSAGQSIATGQTPGPTQGGSSAVPAESTPAELTKVKIAWAAFQDVNSMYVGIEKGFFKDAGIELEIQNTDWPGGNEALIGNHVDLAGFADSELILANAKNIDVTMVLPLFEFAGGAGMYDSKKHPDWKTYDEFLSQTNGDRKGALKLTLEQMKGVKIGTLIPGGEYGTLLVMSDYTGLDFKDFDLVNLTQEDLPPALFNGSIDVMLGGIPQRLAALKQGYKVLYDQSALPSTAAHAGFAAHRSWATDHMDLLVTMQQVIFRTQQYILDNPAESYDIIATHMREQGSAEDPQDLYNVWNKMEFFSASKEQYQQEIASPSGKLYWKDRYEELVREFKKDGTLTSDLPVPLEDLNWALQVVDKT
jgi:NitT/TauT family transport system substrate-binding protein